MMRIKFVSMADCWEHLGLGGLRGLLLIDVTDWLHGDLFLNNHLCVCVWNLTCEKYTYLQVILSMTCVSVVSHLMERCCVMLH